MTVRGSFRSMLLLAGAVAVFAHADPLVARQAGQPPIAVTIAPDVLARAGIETATATRGRVGAALRVPATVQANAYGQVIVTSTSGGRVLDVPAVIGHHVAKGDVIAVVHSPEVAETERIYLAGQADLTVARQQVARLERLVEIGAASRQELESARAQQTSTGANVESARARLLLLGRTAEEVTALTRPDQMSPRVTYRAPLSGSITARPVNPGQTIDSAAPMVTIVDLGTVWIVGEVYERDLAVARIGNQVSITSVSMPGVTISGRITYVDPQVTPDARTARVRVEVPNTNGRLLLGMLMEMRIDTAGADAVLVPRKALQTIGDTPVVYIADAAHAGSYVERSVRLGTQTADAVEIVSGVRAGEIVVTSGSFLIRSERDRVHPGPARPVGGSDAPRPAAERDAKPPVTFDVSITSEGFSPAEISVPAGVPLRLRFTRKVEKTCATEVVFPVLKITRQLPVGKAVVIELPPQPAGRLSFACGMDMYKGQVIVR